MTQKLIAMPYLEANLHASDIRDQNIGAGLSDVEFGLHTRYEISRKFAPYIDIRREQSFGNTSTLKKRAGERSGTNKALLGLRVLF